MSEDKPKRSYAKASYKTKPYTVRFDTEKFDFFMSREKLKTAQQLVDYFLNKFWWEHKVAKPTHKDSPPEYDAPKIENPIHDEPAMWAEPKQVVFKSVAEWVQEKRQIGDEDEFIQWEKKLDADPILTDKEKKFIKTS